MADFSDLIGTGGGASGIAPKQSKTARKASSNKRTGKTSAPAKRTAKKTSKPVRVESVAGDVVQTTGGESVSIMPASIEDVARMAPAWVGEWCELHAVPDMRKASPLVFRACCQDIGARYVKPSGILKDKRPHGLTPTGGASTCGAYDAQAVAALYSVFCRVCGEWDKVPFASTFAGFSGVSLSYVREYTQALTSAGLDIAKRTHDAEMDALRQQAGRDPVGRLAILNNEHWGGGASSVDASGASPALDGIPAAGSFGMIAAQKLD